MNLQAKIYDDRIIKGTLYKMGESKSILCSEQQDDGQDMFYSNIILKENQYAYYAHEYRSPIVNKENASMIDVFIIIIDEQQRKMKAFALDLKRNLFSIDVMKADMENYKIIAINVEKFIKQVNDTHKYYRAIKVFLEDKIKEDEFSIALVTRNFDSDKIHTFLSKMQENKNNLPKGLLKKDQMLKLKLISLETIRKFLDKKIIVNGKEYTFEVFILEKEENNNIYSTSHSFLM